LKLAIKSQFSASGLYFLGLTITN